MWWDQLDYIFTKTKKKRLAARWSGGEFSYEWDYTTDRQRVLGALIERLKRVPDAESTQKSRRWRCEQESLLPKDPPSPWLR